MKLAIMQPYLFPYIGYFQLINTADKFVIYDDVNFIKGGWINRNRILIAGQPAYINLGMKDASPFKLICEIELDENPLWRSKMLKKIQTSYGKAPHFQSVRLLLEEIIEFPSTRTSDFISNSLTKICEFLEIRTKIVSSKDSCPNRGLHGKERVLDICQLNGANVYINSIGGQHLYDKDYFLNNGIELKFLKTNQIIYTQFQNKFVPNLSIIDLLMFNSKEIVKGYLNEFEFV